VKKALLLITGGLVMLALGFVLFREHPPPADIPAPPVSTPTPRPTPVRHFPKATPPPVTPRAPGRPALTPPDPAELRPVPPHPDAAAIGTGVFTPEQELKVLAKLLLVYRETIGSVPAGESNAQIMNALRGNNPERQSWFPYEHPRLNDRGELLDPWGTPYFFHSLSRTRLDLHSAGPDRELFTADDVTHP
jgi:hypothetical protein